MEGYKIERKSSIEKEPQTLSLDQIKYAREAALYVLSTHSIEEAIRIFTETSYVPRRRWILSSCLSGSLLALGLQPVPSVKNLNWNTNTMMDSDEDSETSDRIAVDHVLAGLRDTVTAPF